MPDATDPLARLAEVARYPRGSIEHWRSAHPGEPVVGVLPMNFPREIAYAAGTLPVVVQDDQQPVTEGRSLLAEFYCGYTRNLADQAATGRLDCYDALFLADHCIQLIGAADVVRTVLPQTPVFFGMLISSMSDTVATGYGRRLVPGAGRTFTEITCHARGTAAMCPGVRLVIDIGGQDSKAITVDESGLVEDFAMNDRCASGTGRFYEVLARALECELDELPSLALRCFQGRPGLTGPAPTATASSPRWSSSGRPSRSGPPSCLAVLGVSLRYARRAAPSSLYFLLPGAGMAPTCSSGAGDVIRLRRGRRARG